MANRNEKNRFSRRTLIGLLVLLVTLSLLAAIWDWKRVESMTGDLAAQQARGLVQQIRRQVELTAEGDLIMRNEISAHLLSVADLIATREDLFDLSSDELSQLSQFGGVDQLALFNPAGVRIVSTDEANEVPDTTVQSHLEDLLFDEDGVIELGLYLSEGQPHTGILARIGDGALLVGAPASTIVEWRSKAGLTALLEDLTLHPEVRYALIFSGDQILAATDTLPLWINGENDPFAEIASNATEPTTSYRTIDGEGLFEVAAPLETFAGVTLRLGLNTSALTTIRQRAKVAMFLRTFLFIVMSGLLLAWFVIREHHAALQVEAARIRAEVVRLEAARATTARLEAMGRLAGGVAHEIRNPLNTIEMVAQRLEVEFEPREDGEEYSKLLRATREESRRIARIVQEFLEFARPPKANKQPGDLTALMEEVATAFAPSAKEKGAEFEVEIGKTSQLTFDGAQIRAAAQNLLRNALEAVPSEGGRVRLTLEETEDGVLVEVSDNGPGVPPEERTRIFHLYYTTKASGTGVGLALVHRIADEHGGNIEVLDAEPQGARFRMTLKRELL